MPRPYRSFSGSLVDPEKQYLAHDDEESDSSVVSSRSTSASHTPMLKHQHLPLHNVAWSRRFPKRHFTRYFTLAISTSLLLFIFFLVKASWVSQAEVAAGVALKQSSPDWEQFPFLQKYYGGIRSLVDRSGNDVEYPLSVDDEISRLQEAAAQRKAQDEARSNDKRQDWQSRAQRFDPFTELIEKPVSCHSFVANGSVVPQILSYSGVPRGFPNAVMGSYDVLGIRNDVCFDRYGRLGPYGYGYSSVYGGSSAGMSGDVEDRDNVWSGQIEVDYRTVNWFDAQEDCLSINSHRFRTFHSEIQNTKHWTALNERDLEPDASVDDSEQHQDAQHEHNNSSPTHTTTTTAAQANPTEHAPMTVPSMPLPVPAQHADHTPPGQSTPDAPAPPPNSHFVQPPPHPVLPTTPYTPPKPHEESKDERRLLPRTAVLIRTWDDYNYDDEDMFNLRAIINELSIQSGAEYEIHFLVHLHNESQSVWADESEYKRVLRASLPDEFDGMGTLWSEKQMALLYGGLNQELWHNLPVHGVYRSTFMPVQYFAQMHPEYDFIWNWEMDIRYTGHFYHLFDKASKFARDQPRKGLWERNGRFYVPSKHGSFEDFRQMVRVQSEHGTASKASLYSKFGGSDVDTTAAETPIWGSYTPDQESDRLDGSHDPVPPGPSDKDNYNWGVGEDADLITFNPIFDPQGTDWIIANDIVGYNSSAADLPRRASIGTGIRLSRRLLQTMHRETALHGHNMGSEMWPATCALHHGFKAVYVPHPVYIDRAWPTSYLAAVYNNGRNGASGGARSSIFSDKRQHNFKGTTWYYDAVFGAKLWQRWLGYKVDEEGGEEYEVSGEGRMCLPAMLLHPVKQVDLIIERAREQIEQEMNESS